MSLDRVNAVVELYADVENSAANGKNYIGAFDRLTLEKNKEGKLQTSKFFVVTRFNLLGTSVPAEAENNPVEKKRGCLEVKVVLSKCSTDKSQQKMCELTNFEIDLQALEPRICKACFHYLNRTYETEVSDLVLDYGAGIYVVKVAVRWKAEPGEPENEFTVQSMYWLEINDASA